MSDLKKKLHQKMRRLKAQLMGMVSGKSHLPPDSINLSDSATYSYLCSLTRHERTQSQSTTYTPYVQEHHLGRQHWCNLKAVQRAIRAPGGRQRQGQRQLCWWLAMGQSHREGSSSAGMCCSSRRAEKLKLLSSGQDGCRAPSPWKKWLSLGAVVAFFLHSQLPPHTAKHFPNCGQESHTFV